MALKTKIAKLEDVAEPLREQYEAKDGVFVLKVDGDAGDLFPGLSESQKALLAEKKTLADKLKTLEGQLTGVDLEKAKKALADLDKAEEDKAKQKGDWDNWKAQMQAKHDEEKAALTGRLTEAETALESELITARATSAIAEAKGVPALLLPHVGAKVVNENGKREVRVFDANGQTRYGKDGKPLTIAERIAEMKSDQVFGRAFEASGAGGSGAQNNTSGGGNTCTLSRAQAKDPAAYRAAKEQAAKAGATVTISD